MTRSGRDVNEIWAKLKADNLPKKDGKVSKTAPIQRDEGNERGGGAETREIRQSEGAAESFEGFKDVNEAENLFKRTINSLTEGDHGVRRKAVKSLAASLRTCEDVDLRTDVFVEVVAKPLLRRFDDKNEKCRELAILAITENVQVCKDDAVESLLPYCIPVLAERLNLVGGTESRSLVELGAEILQHSHVNRVDITDFSRVSKQRGSQAETSEEVRLLLAKLLRSIITYGTHALKPYGQDICEILLVLTHDPFHEVLVEGCGGLIDFVGAMGKKLWMVSKILLAGFAPSLGHRRQAVRVAALDAVSVLVFNGAHESLLDLCSFRDPNVVPVRAFFGDDLKINYMGKLITDSCVRVRQALVRCVGTWLLDLPERRDHESRLLPYLLSGLIDEDVRVQAESLEILSKLGDLYIADNAEDMKDKLYYLPDEAHAHGWMQGGVWRAIQKGRVPVPRPFTERLSLGMRLLVQQNFKGSLTALSKELSSWQEEPRLKAAKLLRIFLVCMEDFISSCLEKLLPALCQANITEDKDVKRAITETARILSWYADPRLSLSLLSARLSPSFEVRTRESALAVLTAVATGCAEVGTMAGQEEALATLMAEFDLHVTNDTALKRTAIEFCRVVGLAGAEGSRKESEPTSAFVKILESLVLLSTNALGREGGTGVCAAATDCLVSLLAECRSETLKREALERVLRRLCVEEEFLDDLPPETHLLGACQGLLVAREGLGGETVSASVAMDVLRFIESALEIGPAYLSHTLEAVGSCLAHLLRAVPSGDLGEGRRREIVAKFEDQAKECDGEGGRDGLEQKVAALAIDHAPRSGK